MGPTSSTIDRHTPVIPPSIWFGVSPEQERLYTKIKNKIILPGAGIRMLPGRDRVRKVITDEILLAGERAIAGASLEPSLLTYLLARGLSRAEIERYGACSTAKLLAALSPEEGFHLSLRPLQEFDQPVVRGVSFPFYFAGRFCGFVTRFTNVELVKYAVSVPNRMCFGVDLGGDEVTVVEGVFDAIALRRLGHNVLGMADSQPNYYRMLVASRFRHVHLLLDDDVAGWWGAVKSFLVLTEVIGKPVGEVSIWRLLGHAEPEPAVVSNSLRRVKVSVAVLLELIAAHGH